MMFVSSEHAGWEPSPNSDASGPGQNRPNYSTNPYLGGNPSPSPAAEEETQAEPCQEQEEEQEETSDLAATVAQLTEELARERASFHNFRSARAQQAVIERDRTRSEVIKALLPVLDDLDRAEKHGDLEEGSPFAAIANKIRSALQKLGLRSFGTVGDLFDPNLHEALSQVSVPGATGETVLEVVEPGYALGEATIRAAKVVVQVGDG